MEIAWSPSGEQVRNANVTRFMQTHGLPTLQKLLAASRRDIAWFWDAVVKDLDIRFEQPYRTVLDARRGNAWTRWFADGRISLVHNCVDKWAAVSPGAPAIRWEGEEGTVRELTYADLRHLVDRVAGALRRQGVGINDTVAIFMPPSPEAAAALLACARIGAIAVPVFSGYSAGAVAARLNDAGARLLLTADGFPRRGSTVFMKETADAAVANCPAVRTVVVWPRLQRTGFPMTPGRDLSWDEFLAGADPAGPDSWEPEQRFLLCYTSGTTGKPKGAVLVQGGTLVQFAQITAHHLDVHRGDVHFWPTDMGWIMGPLLVVGTLALGATALLYDGFAGYPDADRLWGMVARHRINVLGVSPSLVRGLAAAGSAPDRFDLSSLRILSGSGEPWDGEAWNWLFNRVGGRRCPVINLSGGTEVGGAFLSPLPVTPLKPCTLGHAALGMDVDIFDSGGNSAPAGAVGELVCRKPWPAMTRGIWRDDERYISTYWKPWPEVWRHGDWASRDESGFWYLHGRSDDTLNIAGKRLGPAEVESVLTQHAAVAEAAAIAVPHAIKGDSLWCLVTLRPGNCADDSLVRELKLLVAQELGKAFRPERVVFASELPKTRTAKIVRRAIRAAVLNQDAGDLSGLENPEAIDKIRTAICAVQQGDW